VLDLGTGSGAIAVAIAHARRDASGYGRRMSRRRHLPSLRGMRSVMQPTFASFRATGSRHWRGTIRPRLHPSALRGARGPASEARRPALRAAGGAARRTGWHGLHPTIAVRGANPPRAGWAGCCWSMATTRAPACVRLLVGLGYTDVADIQDLSGLPRVCKGRFDAPPHAG